MFRSTPPPSCSLRFFAVALLSSFVLQVDAFISLPTKTSVTSRSDILHDVVVLNAKKKQRRRKQSDAASSLDSDMDSTSAAVPSTNNNKNQIDELPDFDLDADNNTPSSSSSSRRSSTPTKPISSPDVITPNMMASNKAQEARSIKELIADRALEQKFQFDEDEDNQNNEIPDLLQMDRSSATDKPRRRNRTTTTSINNNKTPATEEETNLLDNIPFINVKGEDGKISPLKIIETGTWIGIFLLIAWEIYINSPLFDRAAPMAPVVY